MRAVWITTAVLLVLAAVAAAWWPHIDSPRVDPINDARAIESVSPQPLVTAVAPIAAAPMPRPGSTTSPKVTVGAKAVVERVDHQSVRLDGKYVVRGSGSESDPYQITWELLASAARTVDASKSLFEVPGRIADLRGAWIQISGYWAPPLQVFETKEAMFMLNKWDGCCIGLPPTPFDSIEVTFAKPFAVQGQHVFRYGTIKGRLEIEPFAAGMFLLGFYRLQGAVMESTS
ncbi:MAG: DUF3299 domain-containing protein [Planctomycetota bacterium]|nr:DUF3299 domain-containing protein [Planctomycetota bacterium]